MADLCYYTLTVYGDRLDEETGILVERLLEKASDELWARSAVRLRWRDDQQGLALSLDRILRATANVKSGEFWAAIADGVKALERYQRACFLETIADPS
jgi:hypothetical protein